MRLSRLLRRMSDWLDSRFPAKVVVTATEYANLENRIHQLEIALADVKHTAAHVDAVRDVVLVVKAMKDDVQSFKTSLGFNRPGSADILATLNGDPIGDGTNG